MTTAGTLINRRTSRVLAALTELAADRRSRRRGLLGRESLPPSGALLLVPCQAIHTWFMRFPIDVLFMDCSGRVLKTCPHVSPWKIRACPAATGVVELPAGVIEHTGTRVGDAIDLSFQGDKVLP